MIAEEVTIGIYINGKLDDVLIVPDGHEYHLFLTGVCDTQYNFVKANNPQSIGSIVFVNDNWIYEGEGLTHDSQKEIAEYIITN